MNQMFQNRQYFERNSTKTQRALIWKAGVDRYDPLPQNTKISKQIRRRTSEIDLKL